MMVGLVRVKLGLADSWLPFYQNRDPDILFALFMRHVGNTTPRLRQVSPRTGFHSFIKGNSQISGSLYTTTFPEVPYSCLSITEDPQIREFTENLGSMWSGAYHSESRFGEVGDGPSVSMITLSTRCACRAQLGGRDETSLAASAPQSLPRPSHVTNAKVVLHPPDCRCSLLSRTPDQSTEPTPLDWFPTVWYWHSSRRSEI